MALYEITFLTREESDPGVRAAIEEFSGTVESEQALGRRKLAYPIKKETQAVYTSFVFDAPATSIAAIDRRLRLNNDVVRFLIVTKDPVKADKEVSKTVREAIEAADKLEDITEEAKTEKVVAPEVTVEDVAEAVVAEETEVAVENAEEAVAPEVTAEPVEKPAKKTRSTKKAEPADAAEATEEDRLKALEDRLGEILKD